MFINFYIFKIIEIQIGLLLERYRYKLSVDFGLRESSVISPQIRPIIDTVIQSCCVTRLFGRTFERVDQPHTKALFVFSGSFFLISQGVNQRTSVYEFYIVLTWNLYVV